MKENETASPAEGQSPLGGEPCASDFAHDDGRIPALARQAVETFVLRGHIVKPEPPNPDSLLNSPSACFVCIKSFGRELRGCVGTIEPEKNTLAEEVIANAIKAASRDPRFPPLAQDELPFVRYSVDILESPEPARFEDLDPAVFGVVVVDHSGSRRGLLLPDIESIETPERQVSVAARKAGIKPGAPLRLYRFRTRRFSERDYFNQPGGR